MTVPPIRPARSRRGPVIAVLMLLFTALLGAAVGVSLDRRFSQLGHHDALGPRGGRFGRPPAAFRDRMASELDLSPAQRASVDSIVERSHREICAVREEAQPRLDSLFNRMRREVEQVLTPEQVEKAEAFRRRHPPRVKGRPACSPGAPRGGFGRGASEAL